VAAGVFQHNPAAPAPEWPDEEPELGPTPRQEPKLSDLEATLVRARDTRQARIEWLMAPGAPEIQSLLDLFERPEWHQRAACRGVDPDLFFPERGSRRYVEALAYCAGCEVRSQCLAFSPRGGVDARSLGRASGRDRKGLRRSVA
jgi:WhiB family transcriptional regulator, redox-sensing transcriptional regulator